MEKLQVESQWNGKEEMMLNIPHFPHLHASINSITNNKTRYPHPYQYFLAALTGIITMIIKDYSEKNCLLIINLYINIKGQLVTGEDFKNIDIEIKLNSNATPEQFTELQRRINNDNTVLSMFKENMVNINWD